MGLLETIGLAPTLAALDTIRQEAAETSDIDLLVEFDRRISLFHLVGTAQYLEELLGVGEDKVDLVIRLAFTLYHTRRSPLSKGTFG